MTNAKSYNINLFNKLSLSSFLHLLISLHLSSNNSHCNSHSLHACFHTCTLSIVWSEHKHHRASSCSLFEILNQPKQKEQNIAIPECGRERCGKIFTTRPATYLLHVLLRAKYLQVLLSVSIPIISGLGPVIVTFPTAGGWGWSPWLLWTSAPLYSQRTEDLELSCPKVFMRFSHNFKYFRRMHIAQFHR